MRAVFIALLSILSAMETFSQSKSTDRQPVVAGRFYTADKETLTKELSKYFTDCKKSPANWKVRAIICPHAGYIYSGKITASAFSATPRNAEFKNIFIIGSSHILAFEGASVYNTGDFITPLGKAIVNREIANKLKNENKVFDFPVDAHRQEHSLEVQIPFIQNYYSGKPMIVPIIIGTNNTATIKKIADALKPWFTPDNLFLISSDFSHYPPYKDAVETDNLTAKSIVSGDPLNFLTVLKKNASRRVPGLVTSMCGWTSGLTLLYLAEGNEKLEYKHIDYCNSGDYPFGDKDGVVGYHSIALIEKINTTGVEQKSSDSFSFTSEEKDQLFNIARNSIKTMLYENKRITIDENKIPANLKKQMGAFVTLKINNTLRGCIGRFVSSDPLYEAVKVSALSSAFEDPRFPPLTKEEYNKTDIEITVLGPMQRINSIDEIKLGKHGIYIKKDFRSGTMLPQVATENGWTVEQFLGYTSRDKAGLGWDGWKDAEIYIYEGVVLEENRK
ncbi:MAG: AmmeMemoRadiSam system protein B [Bacteroidales bacterium]|nr:AmmeMemoRadiSam system protein B [Bacteroidales bacterium]